MPVQLNQRKRPAFKVYFEWTEYHSKKLGIQNMSVVVEAANRFEAASIAWASLAPLGLQEEPKKFNVDAVEVCND